MSLSACGKKDEPPAPEATATANSTTSSGVTREVVEAPVPAPVPVAPAAIQTQPGPKGSQVALNKVAVTGDVMTVQLSYVGGSGYTSPELDQISVIDDATAQRISILKDNGGKWMAAPLNSSAKELWIGMGRDPVIVWMKFPAPPATSKTVSINIPEVAPFDGVPVTR